MPPALPYPVRAGGDHWGSKICFAKTWLLAQGFDGLFARDPCIGRDICKEKRGSVESLFQEFVARLDLAKCLEAEPLRLKTSRKLVPSQHLRTSAATTAW